MRAMLNITHIGFDSGFMRLDVKMVAYHVEAGARTFREFSKRMVSDLSESIKPHPKGI